MKNNSFYTASEIAGFIIVEGIQVWMKSLRKKKLEGPLDKNFRAKNLFVFTSRELRQNVKNINKYPFYPRRMSKALKEEVIKILTEKLPDSADHRHLL